MSMKNNVQLIGRIVADPELKTTGSGIALAKVRIAVDGNIKRNANGQPLKNEKGFVEKETDFFTVTFWKEKADQIIKFFSKGQMIAIQGYLKNRQFVDNAGNKRSENDIEGITYEFWGSKQTKPTSEQEEECPPQTEASKETNPPEDEEF